jgi:hypothetical protein
MWAFSSGSFEIVGQQDDGHVFWQVAPGLGNANEILLVHHGVAMVEFTLHSRGSLVQTCLH